MNVRRISAIVLRQLYLVRGSFVRLFNIFTWVFVDIILWGFLTRYLNQMGEARFDFVPVLLGAVVLWGILSQIQRGFILAFLEDVYTRNFLNLFASPLRFSEYIIGLTVSAFLTTALATIAIITLAAYLFGFSPLSLGFALIPFALTLSIFGVALGVIASAIVLRVGPSGEWLAWPIPAFISPFVGIFYPVSVLPLWMQHVSMFVPPSYVFQGMRTLVLGGRIDLVSQWVAVGLSLVGLFLASWIFVHVYRYAIRHGLISRFGAESSV